MITRLIVFHCFVLFMLIFIIASWADDRSQIKGFQPWYHVANGITHR